jgi:hypothetical protein
MRLMCVLHPYPSQAYCITILFACRQYDQRAHLAHQPHIQAVCIYPASLHVSIVSHSPTHVDHGTSGEDFEQNHKSISSRLLAKALCSTFFIRTVLLGLVVLLVSRFPPGFGPSFIRRAQAMELRTREKREQARSVGERIREPHFLVANPPPLVALLPPAPPLANPPAGCLHSAVPPLTSLYSAVWRVVCLYSTVGQLLPSRLVDTPGRCSSICLGRHGLGRRGGANVRRAFERRDGSRRPRRGAYVDPSLPVGLVRGDGY